MIITQLQLVLTLGISVVLTASAEYNHSFTRLEGSEGTWEVVLVQISEQEQLSKTLCAEDVDDVTISVFCSLSGYTAFNQVEVTEVTVDPSITIGYKARCTKWDLFKDCKVEEVTGCTNPLVFNCTAHYTSLLGDVSDTDLLLPAILIPLIVLYVLALCVLEFWQKKQKEETRDASLKASAVQAFERTPSKKDCQEV